VYLRPHPYENLYLKTMHAHVLDAEKFETRDVRWAPDGKGFILFDKDQFCCASEAEDERSWLTQDSG